jgi:hypothetical protein
VKRDKVPSSVPNGDLALSEVRQVNVDLTPQSVPEGQQYQVDGSHFLVPSLTAGLTLPGVWL